MSVASTTKTKMYTAVLLGIVVALSVSPTWAITTPGVLSAVEKPVVSTQWTQDLSVLWSKLKERFSSLSQEVRSLGKANRVFEEGRAHESASRVLDLNQWIPIISSSFGQDAFGDIADDPYKQYINRLSMYGVLVSSSRFFPQNYLLGNDFVVLVQKLSLKRYGKELPSSYFSSLSLGAAPITKRQLYQAMQLLDWLPTVSIEGNLYDKLTRSEAAYYLVRFFDLPPLSLDSYKVAPPSFYYFSDVVWHPYAYAINVLASRDIVSRGTATFYPDNYLRHYDFALIFVNSLLSAQNASLPGVYHSTFADVPLSASYYPQLAYATDLWLFDYLVVAKNGQLYAHPTMFVTKHAVYQTLSRTLGVEFSYDVEQASMQKMTRAELAQLLVYVLDLSPVVSSPSLEVASWWVMDDTLLSKLKVLLSML